MREFVVIGHEAGGGVSLDDLPGSGRMDLLARCVAAGLFTSHGIRDARVHLVVDDVTVRFDGATARNLRPDERSTAARIRDGIAAREDAIGHQPADVSPGVECVRFGLAETLDATDGPLVWLHEDGEPVADAPVPDDPTFVLSDHRPFTDADRETIRDRAATRLRLGPRAIHADHAISVAHNWLDTAGYTRY